MKKRKGKENEISEQIFAFERKKGINENEIKLSQWH